MSDLEYKTNSEVNLIDKNTINCTKQQIYIDGDVNIFEDELEKCEVIYNISCNSNVKVQIFNGKAVNRTFNLYGDSNLTINQIVFDIADDNTSVNLNALNANVKINTLAIANSKMDLIQNVNHKAKRTESVISNYGVSLKGGNISFITTGKIEREMAKSKCRQLSKGIVLENDSSVLSKPILLIDEYDVEAYHGASIGKMSDDELFYLMSRGLSKTDAFKLILSGVVKPFIDDIMIESKKNLIEKKISSLL